VMMKHATPAARMATKKRFTGSIAPYQSAYPFGTAPHARRDLTLPDREV